MSKLNLELKCFANNFPAIRKILKEIGARKIAVKKQVDYFFPITQKKNGPPRRLKARVENAGITLVFYERPLFLSNKRTPSKVALYVIDRDTLDFLKESLTVKTIVEKTRELWKKGSTVFHLDTVKNVGKIFEIEIWTTPATLNKDKLRFDSYKKKLLPYLGKIVPGSNEDLVIKR